MKAILPLILNLLPVIIIIILLVYFYFKKKIPGLLWLVAGYTAVLMFQFSSTLGLGYIKEMGLTSEEMQQVQTWFEFISFVTHLFVVTGLAIVFSHYPGQQNKSPS